MHDIRTIRDNPGAFDAALSRRGMSAVSSVYAYSHSISTLPPSTRGIPRET